MIFDWQLWPILMDRRWMDDEFAKRMAAMNLRAAAYVRATTISAREATDAAIALQLAWTEAMSSPTRRA